MGEENSSNKSQDQARRKILRTLVAGGGVLTAAKATPTEWVRPVVQGVVLPAHAQTSAAGPGDPTGTFTSGTIVVLDASEPGDMIAQEPISEELLEFFLPSASAQQGGCSNGSCNVTFGMTVEDGPSGTICVGGDSNGDAALLFSSPTSISGAGGMVGDFFVLDGQFSGGRWNVNVNRFDGMSNVSTTVVLSPGPDVCIRPQ